jgi:hypothetical protein
MPSWLADRLLYNQVPRKRNSEARQEKKEEKKKDGKNATTEDEQVAGIQHGRELPVNQTPSLYVHCDA